MSSFTSAQLVEPYLEKSVVRATNYDARCVARSTTAIWGAVMPPQSTVATFLAQLPPMRRKELSRVRTVIRKNLPSRYQEVLRGQMIVYEMPLATYPDTYNGHPLWFAALAAPKSYLTVHLMPVYGSAELLRELTDGFLAAGKKLDIVKACIHFQTAEDLAWDVIESIIASVPLHRWMEIARAARRRMAEPGKMKGLRL